MFEDRNAEEDKRNLILLLVERTLGNRYDISNRGFDLGFDSEIDGEEFYTSEIDCMVEDYTRELLEEIVYDISAGYLYADE